MDEDMKGIIDERMKGRDMLNKKKFLVSVVNCSRPGPGPVPAPAAASDQRTIPY